MTPLSADELDALVERLRTLDADCAARGSDVSTEAAREAADALEQLQVERDEARALIAELRCESAEEYRYTKYVVVQMTPETWDRLKAWGAANNAEEAKP